MQRLTNQETIQLSGFNNLTKALSFNLYDFCVARNEKERKSYIDYIANRYSAAKITEVLRGICDIIEANVLAVSDQDYDPWGASSLVLMSDIKGGGVHPDLLRDGKAMHLDKSHICAHTYPDFTDSGVCSFRIDIDIATCGDISPLRALNFMFANLDADVVVADYVVRGFTRDLLGKRVFMDHKVRSIQDYIEPDILKDYFCIDLALQSDNIWQTKMLRTSMDVPEYFADAVDPNDKDVKHYMEMVNREMRGVLQMWPD